MIPMPSMSPKAQQLVKMNIAKSLETKKIATIKSGSLIVNQTQPKAQINVSLFKKPLKVQMIKSPSIGISSTENCQKVTTISIKKKAP
jgi:hypothetical protein